MMLQPIAAVEKSVVYVVGAGLSAGLGFPTIRDLLLKMWPRLRKARLTNDLAKVIRFHHPNFNPSLADTYPNVEQLLSEMGANVDLFDSSRPATGNFTIDALDEQRQAFLLELANWFLELQANLRTKRIAWLDTFVANLKEKNAKIISFNWDLVLDERLFGEDLNPSSYGLGNRSADVCMIKPHGSLNWYLSRTGQYISGSKKFSLAGTGRDEVFAFKEYRAPKSSRREYMPLIVPPVYFKKFRSPLFRRLWQESVSILSTASEVVFLGYSMPEADFHARFILRCGFYNQENGQLLDDGSRAMPTGRARVTIVDPGEAGPKRLTDVVGWQCLRKKCTVEQWVDSEVLDRARNSHARIRKAVGR